MIEQQQQQILNSIMIANRQYYNHSQLLHNQQQQQQQHPQSSSQSSSSSAVVATKSSLVKIMSNPGATNSVVAAAMNNNKTAAQPANGMSPSSALIGMCSGAAPASPRTQQQQQPPAIANKMGSRRIFSPHFKIQVLESYRNDSDCKGNQRATARKYGIHRRQIQKWLQCETALRTSVSSNGGSPPIMASKQQVDSNNNNGQRRTLNGSPKASFLSTSSNQGRHSVDSNDSGAVRLAEDCASVSETHTRVRLGNATHTRQNSVEFFSSSTTTTTTTTSLIINGGAANISSSTGGGPDGGDGGRKIESMNEAAAAAVPIKPESSSSASLSAVASPRPTSAQIGRSSVEMPSKAAAMLKHQHHHLLHHDLYQIHGGGGGGVEEDAPHHSLMSTVPNLPPFISTIYGPQSLLGFPCALPFDYHPPALALPSALHQYPLSPIDLSVGNAERRHAVDFFRRSPLALLDDARVPSRSVSGDELKPTAIAIEGAAATSSSAPIDLSCSRKRKSSVAEPVKPPKLFKPYLLDDQEEEEELKVVDDEEVRSTTSTKEDHFLDQDLTGLRDKHSHRFEYPTAFYPPYPGSSPIYESFYFGGHENLTLYPSPRQHGFESSPSARSSPLLHHPSRPASLFDSSSSSTTSSSEAAYVNYHASSPASSSDIRSSPPVFSGHWSAVHEMRSRVSGSVF